ncbi:MAG: D-glycero-beta-D-manno-heptose 1-phosphate adenylyltransferase [Bdellovibrionales bacterium]|jgi:D-glycero-beta-D-manno-heptose 1-phosphate adenylyltransferase|nr:D-glycero-beta-D-manno-heptose 1-phosphate adenylyltransferase [Bdellovibrionales bacterium]MBT3526058.1 D-glycero-beta-D-manno-heptose 1-phosphate adenylyltransferase [Bdellovibrionales bacterium]MBT7669975.1 D-glycero-beta-D-manno-heptose 1-phosphate adenylyltransferase [Bdellovibrionales bacterium]MBT7766716.1 D-glycero-beta-D-manno-heptose 1-phosphate adenylyltransferase [Bdellovibrionales bacterium]
MTSFLQLSTAAIDFLATNQDKKIVFTNGCFDLVHLGHLEYLAEARALGDLLFLGLNSDRSVQELKGSDRPIIGQLDRKAFLEHLRVVDFVEIFDEPTPLRLINDVSPEVLVKGGDWGVKQIVGHEIVIAAGGEVRSLSFKDSYSTTSLIEKMQGKS